MASGLWQALLRMRLAEAFTKEAMNVLVRPQPFQLRYMSVEMRESYAFACIDNAKTAYAELERAVEAVDSSGDHMLVA